MLNFYSAHIDNYIVQPLVFQRSGSTFKSFNESIHSINYMKRYKLPPNDEKMKEIVR